MRRWILSGNHRHSMFFCGLHQEFGVGKTSHVLLRDNKLHRNLKLSILFFSCGDDVRDFRQGERPMRMLSLLGLCMFLEC